MIYGHPKYLAETFVDLSLYRGSCYRAANWIYLGKTKGFSKNGGYYYPILNPQHRTIDKGHGRIEERRIWVSDELN